VPPNPAFNRTRRCDVQALVRVSGRLTRHVRCPHYMGATCSVFIATSLDGFIARPDGSIDWLEHANAVVPPPDCGYGAYMRTVDGLVMGRHSFEFVMSFAEWPYGTTPVHVLSSRMTALPPAAPATVSLSREEPAQLVDRLSQRGARHLYIDGGVTIQRFLRAGLIDQLIVTQIPVLLGQGRPLFGPTDADVFSTTFPLKPFRSDSFRVHIVCEGAPNPSIERTSNRLRRSAAAHVER
jgi:dihydrofolate reductase